jgi:hypothetical protein
MVVGGSGSDGVVREEDVASAGTLMSDHSDGLSGNDAANSPTAADKKSTEAATTATSSTTDTPAVLPSSTSSTIPASPTRVSAPTKPPLPKRKSLLGSRPLASAADSVAASSTLQDDVDYRRLPEALGLPFPLAKRAGTPESTGSQAQVKASPATPRLSAIVVSFSFILCFLALIRYWYVAANDPTVTHCRPASTSQIDQ